MDESCVIAQPPATLLPQLPAAPFSRPPSLLTSLPRSPPSSPSSTYFDFAIKTPGTPARWAEYDLEMETAFQVGLGEGEGEEIGGEGDGTGLCEMSQEGVSEWAGGCEEDSVTWWAKDTVCKLSLQLEVQCRGSVLMTAVQVSASWVQAVASSGSALHPMVWSHSP